MECKRFTLTSLIEQEAFINKHKSAGQRIITTHRSSYTPRSFVTLRLTSDRQIEVFLDVAKKNLNNRSENEQTFQLNSNVELVRFAKIKL